MIIVPILLSILITWLFARHYYSKSSSDLSTLQNNIVSEVKNEFNMMFTPFKNTMINKYEELKKTIKLSIGSKKEKENLIKKVEDSKDAFISGTSKLNSQFNVIVEKTIKYRTK